MYGVFASVHDAPSRHHVMRVVKCVPVCLLSSVILRHALTARTTDNNNNNAHYSKVLILLGQRLLRGHLQLTLVLLHERRVHAHLGRRKSGRCDKLEVGVTGELAR